VAPRLARRTRRTSSATPRPKVENSPYFGVEDPNELLTTTKDLVAAHPLPGPDIAAAVMRSWESIFQSRLGSGFHIGREIKPEAQIMGFLLHALIPLELAKDHDGWRAGLEARDKDVVYMPNELYSIEIKTSTNPRQIFGNRSFGVEGPGEGKKEKDGYYLTINFDRWGSDGDELPKIRIIRFGWIDHTDWLPQASERGQASTLPSVVYDTQLLALYDEGSEENVLGLF
jgi:hypothetical protein